MTALVANLNAGLRTVTEIPALQHAEAPALARAEFERVLSLLQSLDVNDWEQPTYCADWNVREMTAHLAGAVAAFASWGEFFRQTVGNPHMRSEEKQVDGLNRRQVEDRAGCSPAELIDEYHQAGPTAIRVRHNIPWPLSRAPILRGEPVSDTSLRYLLDVIYPRDWWMHRYDLCAATGKEMIVDGEHDRRIVELVLRDVAMVLARTGLGDRSLMLELTGEAGGAYRFGPNPQPDTVVRMDLFDFALAASGRIAPEEALARATVAGSPAVAEWFFQNCEVLF